MSSPNRAVPSTRHDTAILSRCHRKGWSMADGSLFSNHTSQVPRAVVTATVVSCSISALCCAVFLLTYLAFPSTRSSPRKLLCFISLMDMFTAVSFGAGASTNMRANSTECVVQSVVSTYSTMSSFFWVVALGVFLLVTIYTVDPLFAEGMIRYFHLVCWGLPLGVVIVALAHNSLGCTHSLTTVGWCWVDTGKPDAVMWMVVTGISWELAAFLALVILGLLIKREMKRKFEELSIAKFNGTLKSMKKIEKKMWVLPFLFAILRIWDLLRFHLAVTKSPRVWHSLIMALQGIGNSSHGTVNFVLFFLCSDKTRRMALKELRRSAENILRGRSGERESNTLDEQERLLSDKNVAYYVKTRT